MIKKYRLAYKKVMSANTTDDIHQRLLSLENEVRTLKETRKVKEEMVETVSSDETVDSVKGKKEKKEKKEKKPRAQTE